MLSRENKMNRISVYNELFDKYWQSLLERFRDGERLEYSPREVSPGKGNARRIEYADERMIVLRETTPRGHQSICLRTELRDDFWKLYQDPDVAVKSLPLLRRQHGIKNLVEFKRHLFQDFRDFAKSMVARNAKRTRVFISYSRKDKKSLERLQVHLKPLERENNIEIWDDTRLIPGSKWKEELNSALAATKIAILLISADFLASDFVATNELPQLLHAAENEGAIILPIILSHCLFSRTESLCQFQSINDPSKPLSSLNGNKRDAVFASVADLIDKLLKPQPYDLMKA